MGLEKPRFTGVNFEVCMYCKHLVLEERFDKSSGYRYGCGLRKNDDGKYARVTPDPDEVEWMKKEGMDAVYSLEGCEQFEASGLHAHPEVHSILVEENPKASSIPTDPDATETSWDFMKKVKEYVKVLESGYRRSKIQ